MPQAGWIFNEKRCIGCRSCYVACKAENNTPLRTDWRWVMARETGGFPHVKREFLSLACNHCKEPACLKACPENAISKRDKDGVVLIDQDKCIGCRYCAAVCPYEAPKIDTDTNKAGKCTMCVHRLEQGLLPACATACITGAIQFVPDFGEASGPVPEGFVNRAFTHPNINFILM